LFNGVLKDGIGNGNVLRNVGNGLQDSHDTITKTIKKHEGDWHKNKGDKKH
jgi:hypothetical protein